MAKDPAVLFYTADFLVGVSDMPFLDRGYYITLLCLQHQKGHLPEETIWFSLGLRSVSEIPQVMSHFAKDENGLYYNKRMDEETAKRCKYTESRRSNGGKGGRPKQKHMDNHMDNHMDTHMEDENEDINVIDIKGKGVRGKGFKEPTVDEVKAYCDERKNGVDPKAFVDFYTSKGWMVGKTGMKDWKASIRTWEVRNGKQGGTVVGTGDDREFGGYILKPTRL